MKYRCRETMPAGKAARWNYSIAVPGSIYFIGAMGATMRLPPEKQIKTTLKIQRIEILLAGVKSLQVFALM
jgi:hypothetical protein